MISGLHAILLTKISLERAYAPPSLPYGYYRQHLPCQSRLHVEIPCHHVAGRGCDAGWGLWSGYCSYLVVCPPVSGIVFDLA